MPQVKKVFNLPLRDNNGRELRSEITDVEPEAVARFAWTLVAVVNGMYMMAADSCCRELRREAVTVCEPRQ